MWLLLSALSLTLYGQLAADSPGPVPTGTITVDGNNPQDAWAAKDEPTMFVKLNLVAEDLDMFDPAARIRVARCRNRHHRCGLANRTE
jgi:hypothetical protein